jgi:glyoxylase-like metal-dependent hydrolase (beta-lactamase superfamily II)
MMKIDVMPVGWIETNCFLVTCEETREAILIDPGWPDDAITERIAERQAQVRLIINTHAHFDHIGGNAAFIESTGAPLAIHELDLPLLENGGGAEQFGLYIGKSPPPDRLLEPGEVLEIGRLNFKVLFVPGHTPGHIALYEPDQKVVFAGDVLFHHGIGRTDMPGGSASTLLTSIRNELLTLPDDVTVCSGHGPETTIGEERRSNPWL